MKPSPRNQGAEKEQREQVKSASPAPPAPKSNWQPGEQIEEIKQLPTLPDLGADRSVSLKEPAPKVAPFDAGAIPSAPKEAKEQPEKAQTVPPESELLPTTQAEPVAPKSTINLLDPSKADEVKALIPKGPGIWWNTETDGSGAELKLRWRDGTRQPAFNFPRISKNTLETWRSLPEAERKKTIGAWLLADEGLSERPDIKTRLENALNNVSVRVRGSNSGSKKGSKKGAKGAEKEQA